MRRLIALFIGCAILLGCGELPFLDFDDLSVSFTRPTGGTVLTAADDLDPQTPGIQIDVEVAARLDSDAGAPLSSARLQAKPASLTTNVAPVLGQVQGSTATFSAITVPQGDVQLSASVTDQDRDTVVGTIVVHVQ